MTLHLLDVAPIDESEYQQMQQEKQMFQQANYQLYQENHSLRVELEKFQNMTPKEFKQYYKAKQEDQQTSENVAAPFTSLTSEDNIDLSHSNQATTTEHTVAAAGFGYDGGASSNLLSSIIIVGVSLCLCFLGAVAYRKHNK